MFETTPDQELLGDATRRFLDDTAPPARVRQLAEEAEVFDPVYWRRGAELGWTSFLVPESLGGGSVSGNGLADLQVVAAEFGRHAAPGPLLGTNVVAAALARWGTPEQHAGPLQALVAGDAVAAWGHGSTLGAWGAASPVAAVSGAGGHVLSGRVGPVEGVEGAAFVLVTANGPDGRTRHLVPTDADGVVLTPLNGVDLTRRFHDVTLEDVVLGADSVVGPPGAADEQDQDLLDVLACLLQAEMVGAATVAFEMTLAWTVDRYSFGRPLASYQALKHRLADARTRLEGAEALATQAADAVGSGAADARSWASAGMAFTAAWAPEIAQECVQLHGGIGVTYELDLHLYLRRIVLDSRFYGSASDYSRRLGALVVEAAEVAA